MVEDGTYRLPGRPSCHEGSRPRHLRLGHYSGGPRGGRHRYDVDRWSTREGGTTVGEVGAVRTNKVDFECHILGV